MFEIVWLLFFFVTGVTQMFYYLQPWGNNEAGVSFPPNFGQLLPLILLVLPFLAIVEGYNGEIPLVSYRANEIVAHISRR